MSRTLSVRLAAVISAALLVLAPSRAEAQKALVYCPVGVDATGCNAIVAALTADANLFPGGVDAGYDGMSGTVDLAAADLSGYSALLVPSLADGPDLQPYALLRNVTIAQRLHDTFTGRAAAWSGTPDRGSANRATKDALIRNLAAWVKADAAGTHGPGVVVLQDNSDDAAAQYNWVAAISALAVAGDPTLEVYANVQVLTATGQTILTSGGTQIGYSNMASFGLLGAPGMRSDATGGRSTRVVLVTAAGEPADPNIATVQTDKDDYFPPDTVVVTGAGWEPGETVSLLFHEEDPPRPDVTLTAVADADGHIFNDRFIIDSTHLGARFTLTATGLTSGRTAQTTFTDANRATFSLTAAGAAIASFSPATTLQCVAGFVQARQGNTVSPETGTVTLSSTPAGVSFFAGNACAGPAITSLSFTLESAKSFSFNSATAANPFTLTGDASWANANNDASATVVISKQNQTISFTSTPPSPGLVGNTYAATATATSGLTVSFGTSTPAVCTSSGTNGATINLNAAGTCTVTANQGGDGSYNPAPQVTQTFQVAAQTTTNIASSVNPSNAGQSVTFTATVTQTVGGAPATTGNVTIVEGGTCAAPVTVHKGPTGVNGSGQVTFTTAALSAGSHTITACYAGTATFAPSSNSVTQSVNALPVLTGVPPSATIPELSPYSFDANATDPDNGPQPLSFSLVGGPLGATIDPSTGIFSWTPSEAQGPGTFPFSVRVSDGLANTDAPVSLTVTEVNQAPVLAAIGNKTVNELATLSFTATATDGDLPAQTLIFSLDPGAPAGAALTSAGAFTWTPTEAQGPGTYPVTVRVSDGMTDDFETISVQVNEVNQAPVVAAIADQTVDEGSPLTFTAHATDADLPAQALSFDLVGAPAGAAITTAGMFTWTPTEAQGPGSYTFQVRATDDFSTPASGTTSVKITVNEVNEPPVLAAIGNQAVDELTQLSFSATATDPDLPPNTLTFSLGAGAPAGAAITAAGAFTWTPTEAQGPGDYLVTVRVSDGAAEDFETISIHVNEVNAAPVVAAIPDKTVDELTALTFTASATDPDIPANGVAFSLVGAPAGASINPTTGAFTWTPTEAEGPGVYTFQVRATDDGSPAASGDATVQVTVKEVNVAPVLAAIGDQTVDEETALTFTASATDADLPPNTLTFSLVGAPAGASIGASSGAFSWTPTEAQGPGSFTFTVRVTDNGTPALSDEEEITVTVKEVNKAPVVTAIPDQTVDEETALSFNASAVDPDIPANNFSFSLDGAPAGAAITAAGAFTWTPTEAQGPGTYTFKVIATDDGSPALAGETLVKVTVKEVNLPPVLAAIGDQTVDEETALTFTAAATDPDVPANTLTFALVGAPPGASINPSTGGFSWTPTEAQGPDSYTFTVKVSDGGVPVLSDEEEITVTVKEVNVAPELAAIGDQTVDELSPLAFTASATDHDIPANSLTFSLGAGAPPGAGITAAGAFTWTPTEAQGPGDYTVTVRVTDNGSPALSDFETLTIHVKEVNVAPVLAAIGDKTIDEETALTFTATATDADLPANGLTFSLVGGPAGASIGGSSGVFTWTPSEAQGPGIYTFKLRVTDNGSPALYDDEEISVTVNEVNRAPVLAAIPDKNAPWGSAIDFTAVGTDPDLPANALTYSLRPGAPGAASINPTTGAFTWTPGAADVGPHPITVRVTDNGTPAMYAERSFSVMVEKHVTSVAYSGASSGVYGSVSGLSATLTDVTAGTPLAGKSLGFTIGTLSASATTQTGGAAGLATTTLSLAQNVGSYLVVTTFAEEAAYKGSSHSDPFSITPAPLTVKADNKTMFYGASAPPAFTVGYTGFVLGQNSSALGGSLTFTGSAVGANGSTAVGSYVITPTGLTSINYTIGFVSGTLTVIYNNVAGHQFLQPINPNLTTGNRSSFKIGSTIPAKFELFKADGVTPVTTAVAKLKVYFVDPTPENPINEEVLMLPPDTGDLFKITGGQYHYNIGTKGWQPGTYRVTAQLDDGSEVSAMIDGRSK